MLLNKEKPIKHNLKRLKKYRCFFTHCYHSMAVVKGASFAISLRNILFSSQNSYRNRSVLNSAEKGSLNKASGLPIPLYAFLCLVFWKWKCAITSQQHLLGSDPLVTILFMATVFGFFLSFSTMLSAVLFSPK